jgi:hypothetical protein
MHNGIMSTEIYRIRDVRTYRLGVLRAAGVCGSVVAVLSIAAAFRISDWPMVAVSLLAGTVALLMVFVCSRKLRLTNS